METLNQEKVKNEIADLKKELTGNLFKDSEIQQKIYNLKKQLQPEIVNSPELDEDTDCLNCGA
tara:strand:- start:308 stop:496 length:189 start_codon:yes stop_codon:yes gene_type:complete